MKNKTSWEEIEEKIAEIKRSDLSKYQENTKINEVKKSYYDMLVDKRVHEMAKNVSRNLEYMMQKKNMNYQDLIRLNLDKMGILKYDLTDYKITTTDVYDVKNILGFAMLFGYLFNISFTDFLLYDVEYLEKKKLLSTF
jgi:hypothetical protein